MGMLLAIFCFWGSNIHDYKRTTYQQKLIHFLYIGMLLGQETFSFHYAGRNLVSGSAAAKSLQSCPTLCDSIDGSPPGYPVPGILQARTLKWVVISFYNAWKWKVKVKSLSHVRLLVTPWTAAHQAPPSMGFSRQEYWSGVPLSSPELQCRGSKKSWAGLSH